MDGQQNFDIIDEDAKQLGMFWIIAKYVLPYLAGLILIGIAFYAVNYLLQIDLDPMQFGVGAVILILILILAIR